MKEKEAIHRHRGSNWTSWHLGKIKSCSCLLKEHLSLEVVSNKAQETSVAVTCLKSLCIGLEAKTWVDV